MTVLNPDQLLILELFNLDDKDVQSISYSNLNGDAIVDVFLAPRYEPCPRCKCDQPHIANYVKKIITHSVLTDRKCLLRYHARRYVCPICGRTYYEHNPFVFRNAKISVLTVTNILKSLKNYNETFSSVARRNYISPTTVASIFDQHVMIPRRTLPALLNFDEVYAFHSKHSKFVCVLLDFKTHKPVDLLKSRSKDYLVSYFQKIPLEERKKVVATCSDMYDTYRSVSRISFPNAIQVCDHYHCSAELNRQLDAIRIRVMKGFKEKTSDEYYLLKKFHWFLFKQVDERARDGQPLFDPNRKKKYNQHFRYALNYYELREKMYQINDELAHAWQLKDDVVEFYSTSTIDNAEENLRELITLFHTSGIPEMQSFSRTLAKWSTEIINSFHICGAIYQIDPSTGHVAAHYQHMSSAIIENRNAIIKCLKKNANGYTNWERFRNRAMYILDKDATFTLNPIEMEESIKAKKRKDQEKKND